MTFDAPVAPVSIEEVITHLGATVGRQSIRVASERALGDHLWGVLSARFPGAEREASGRDGRIDFVIGRVGIELKIAGSVSDVTRQLWRYADSGRFDALVLVTSVSRHNQIRVEDFAVPVHIVHLRSI